MINYKFYLYLSVYILLLAACTQKQEVSEVLRPVKYIVAETGESSQKRTFSGIAKVGTDVMLSFRSSGIIIEKNVSKGQTVKKGQLLGRLDNLEAQLDYEKAVAELKRAESEMFTAQTNYNRIKSLYEQEAKPLAEYESAKNAYNSAKSLYETALRNEQIQKSKVGYGFIYSPINGVVLNTNGDVNERIGAGEEFVLLSAEGDRMKVVVQLPESIINSVTLGMKVDVELSALPDQIFIGEISEISPSITSESATYPVDVDIIDGSEEIRPGMAAKVSLNFRTNDNKEKIILPMKSVGEDANGNYVYIVESESEKSGVVNKKQIKIGEMTSFGFEVLEGVSVGDSVVTAGLQTLLDGQKVAL
jgi:RND family efflux transporter MFP subunit